MLFEKNVRIPALTRKRGNSAEDFIDMQVGDSSFFPKIKCKTTLAGCAKQMGWTITRRVMDGGVRYWRVK